MIHPHEATQCNDVMTKRSPAPHVFSTEFTFSEEYSSASNHNFSLKLYLTYFFRGFLMSNVKVYEDNANFIRSKSRNQTKERPRLQQRTKLWLNHSVTTPTHYIALQKLSYEKFTCHCTYKKTRYIPNKQRRKMSEDVITKKSPLVLSDRVHS